jgi:PAS domain S-box-containing protein
MDEETSKIVYQTFNAVYRTGKPTKAFGWMNIRKDGTEVFVEASVSLITGITGEPSGFRGIVRDITERKQVDEVIKESEAQYRDLVERAGIAIVIDDMEGNFAYFNDRYAEMFGYSMEEMRDQTIESTTHPDDVERILGFHHGRIKGEDVPSRFEVRGLRKDGSVFHLELDVGSLEKDGIAIGTRTYLWDISERVLARELLQQSEANYRGIFDGVQDAILVESLDGEIFDANPRACEIFGWSREEMLTKTVSDLVPEGQLAVIPSEITETDLLDHPIETINMRANGEIFPVEFTTRIQTIGGETVMLIVLRDITERKRVEESLEQYKQDLIRSNKDLELFAYAISHDLQEPLRMVASYVELIEKRYKDQLDAEAEEFIDFAVDGAHRMQGMIQGLLELSRVDTRGKPLTPTDTQNVLEQVSANLQVAIETSGLIITHDPLPTVDADEAQLIQLFQNLIGNALKFKGEDKPNVHIKAERTEQGWLFSVRDNGIGLDLEHADRIFLIFQRLHTLEEYPGSGMGLAICKRIVERHGGRIWVESEPGEGATFYFTLPEVGGQ